MSSVTTTTTTTATTLTTGAGYRSFNNQDDNNINNINNNNCSRLVQKKHCSKGQSAFGICFLGLATPSSIRYWGCQSTLVADSDSDSESESKSGVEESHMLNLKSIDPASSQQLQWHCYEMELCLEQSLGMGLEMGMGMGMGLGLGLIMDQDIHKW
ncbi:GH22175 [Drosophila grimshawi]|uniref:GH22175 n=1 Tax=Drosophila grimshawi TaxID=7222 RepID=B4K0M4_DROGR|nr:GH22175 [Drosophila grimshawi]